MTPREIAQEILATKDWMKGEKLIQQAINEKLEEAEAIINENGRLIGKRTSDMLINKIESLKEPQE